MFRREKVADKGSGLNSCGQHQRQLAARQNQPAHPTAFPVVKVGAGHLQLRICPDALARFLGLMFRLPYFSFASLVLVALLAATAANGQVSPGASRAEVIRVLGWPKSTSHSEDREILNYAECTVLMKDGRVEKLVFKSADERLRLWNQLNQPKSSTLPKNSAQVSSVAPQPIPQYRNPVPQASLEPPTPIRFTPEPMADPWAALRTTLIWVVILIVVALTIARVALNDGNRWGQLQRDLLRKKANPPSSPQPPSLAPAPTPKRKPDPLTDGWSLKLLKEIEWHRFEQVVGAYEKTLGHDARLTDFGPDGGIDVRGYDKSSGQLSRIVQCKAFDNQRVDVKLVREFYGVMMHEKVSQGGFYTTSGFTPDAVEFAQGKNLELIDGATFVSRIKQLDLPIQIGLFEVATEGDYTTPTCPSCGIKMVRRKGEFWGCPNFPKCHSNIYGAQA